MRVDLGQLIVRNWPLKLAALFFAAMLYVAVAAQQPVTQAVSLRVRIDGPPGRPPHAQPEPVVVQIAGRGSELLKLRSFPRVITKAIPDTFAGTTWRLRLQPSDLVLPKGVDLQVADIAPRDLEVSLDSAVHRDVPIASRVSVKPDSGYVVEGLSILPTVAHLIGPAKSMAGIESVATVPALIAPGSGPFFHTVPIDTGMLGVVRVMPREVRVSGEATRLSERNFPGVPIGTPASGAAGVTLTAEHVSVSVTGPEPRVSALTRDSVHVIAHIVNRGAPDAFARLTVNAPSGLTATAVPDSVPVKPPAIPPPAPAKSTAKRKPGRG